MIGSALYKHLLNNTADLPKYITDRPQEKQSGGKNKAVLILYKFVYLQQLNDNRKVNLHLPCA